MEIRLARKSDAADILRLTEHAWIEQYVSSKDGVTLQDIQQLNMASDEAIAKQAALLDRLSKRRFTFIAEVHNSFIGYVLLVNRESVGWYVKSIYIKPEYQSKGFGSQLLTAALTQAVVHNASPKYVTLDVATKNQAAIQFYERNNWKRIGHSFITINDHKIPTDTMRINL